MEVTIWLLLVVPTVIVIKFEARRSRRCTAQAKARVVRSMEETGGPPFTWQVTVEYRVRERSYYTSFVSRKKPGKSLVLRYDPAAPGGCYLGDSVDRKNQTVQDIILIVGAILLAIGLYRLIRG